MHQLFHRHSLGFSNPLPTSHTQGVCLSTMNPSKSEALNAVSVGADPETGTAGPAPIRRQLAQLRWLPELVQ